MKIFAHAFALMFTILSLQTFALAAESTKKVETKYWMKFKAKDKYERSRIANLGFEIEGVIDDSVYAVGSEEDLTKAKATNLLTQHFLLGVEMLDFPDKDEKFHNYNELQSEMQSLANEYPSIVKYSSIGNSLEGRELMLLTIAPKGESSSVPAIFFLGGHHAREHVSIEVPLNLAKYLVTEYNNKNPRIVSLLDNRIVYIVPMVNPDGAEYDIANGDYRLWRKNRRNNGGSYGVDLNRNYGYMWGGGGASTNPRNDTYRGTKAFSEPETQAVENFFRTHENISTALSFHTFSQLILYPWGHKYDRIENQRDYLVHKTMAEKMATWNGYTPQQSSELYIASGDTTDWSYGELGVISFTFELDPKASGEFNFNPKKGFYPGQSFIQPTFQKNLEPALYLIEYSDNPYRVIESSSIRYGLRSPLLKE